MYQKNIRGRVRRYENSKKGYEEILKMKPCTIVLEPTGVYAIRPSQYFKEKGIKVSPKTQGKRSLGERKQILRCRKIRKHG